MAGAQPGIRRMCSLPAPQQQPLHMSASALHLADNSPMALDATLRKRPSLVLLSADGYRIGYFCIPGRCWGVRSGCTPISCDPPQQSQVTFSPPYFDCSLPRIVTLMRLVLQVLERFTQMQQSRLQCADLVILGREQR